MFANFEESSYEYRRKSQETAEAVQARHISRTRLVALEMRRVDTLKKLEEDTVVMDSGVIYILLRLRGCYGAN